ncbi:glutaredoxin family protein [Paraglaciecola aquimarina]|uniref:Glutaredoxin family protein n=1 Tax=Paraglaciecola algarum TaxID=3050085 RepID=A0ABS9D548_9ALTE|nr:glutaredoxin family protein [Paraglaciecola sp. G1-23]MCF2947137.1 glutaredoxin family protein [Paraglaciecola sp. G1-23]
MEIILYSGKDCCLCEQAFDMLENLTVEASLHTTKVDVRSSTDLFHRYGARIPVLYRQDTQQELPWPFDMQQLKEFMF